MTKAHDQAILEALEAARDLGFSELFDATGLPPSHLDASLYRLTGCGKVRKLGGGKYRLNDQHHSRCVKRGRLVSSIPRLGALACVYAAATNPVVEHLLAAPWWAL